MKEIEQEQIERSTEQRHVGEFGATPDGWVLPYEDVPGFGLLDTLIVLAKRKRLVLGLPFAAGLTALLISFFVPNTYTAVAKILAPKQNQSMSAMFLNQMGGLAALAGDSLGVKDPNETYVAMLKSRSVADAIISKFSLQSVYRGSTLSDARKELAKRSSISVGHDSVISIEIEDHDPNRAAAIANEYYAQFDKLNTEILTNNAAQRRQYFETELEKARDQLTEAETDLKATQERTGLIDVSDQAKAIIGSVTNLRAQITAAEIRLQGMRTFATEQNPEVIRLEKELAGLKSELAKAQAGDSGGKGDIEVPTSKVPSAGLEYIRKYRQVKYYETLLELISKQYELARLEESNSVSAVQVMDKAIAPEKKSSPKRFLIAMIAFLLGGFVSVTAALLQEAYQRATTSERVSSRLRLLRTLVLGARV